MATILWTILTGDSSIMANEACRQPSQTG